METYLTLHEVAKELGVHYMTIYRYVRTGMLPASKPGVTWQVLPSDLEAFRAERFQGQPSLPDSGEPMQVWRQRYEARLIAGDGAGAWSVLEAALLAGWSATDVYLHAIAPAMNELGDRWRSGLADPREEHRATGIVRRHLGRLAPRFVHRGRSRGMVLLGCVPGERHDIGLSMVADLLRFTGYEVCDLGADVPVGSFEDAALDLGERLVGVGLSVHHRDLIERAESIAEAMNRLPSAPIVLVGGHGVEELDAGSSLTGCVASNAQLAPDLLDDHRVANSSV